MIAQKEASAKMTIERYRSQFQSTTNLTRTVIDMFKLFTLRAKYN